MAQYDFNAVESEIRALWKKINVKELIKKKGGKEKYFLLDGPPYANAAPHQGHARTLIYKDLYIRKAVMEGKDVLFKPGFDSHGLPIENMVERKLNLGSRQELLKFGVKNFIKQCKDTATINKDDFLKVYELYGSYYANETPYITYDNSYIESAWWAFKQMWDKGLVYEGLKPVYWCPHCETSLSGYEVTDSYKMVTDPGVYVKFKLRDEDAYLLVFTTTPWTLPSNVAIAVHKEKDYVKVNSDKGNLIIAKKRLDLLDRAKIQYKILEEFKGSKLVGRKYDPLLDVPQQAELSTNPNAHKVIASIPMLKERIASKTAAKKGIKATDVFEDFVTDEDGTGMVHTAPGHGKTDHEIGNHYHLPSVSPLDDSCKFTALAGKYAGMFVKDADHEIMDDLHKQNKLLHSEKITHKYPDCWRCHNLLIFRMNNQWFIKVQNYKEQMLSANQNITWQPEFAKDRMDSWLANVDDWNISRQRFWGTPIPVWKNDSGDYLIIGSHKELEKLAGKKVADLHLAGDYTITKNGKTYKRIEEIFDVWFDSGVGPFASWNYPFQNKELFDSHFPINRISEGQDQIRGWFYYLFSVSMAVLDKAPYKIVSMPGWVLDYKGEKMSKSQGNMILASEAVKDLGADTNRFYYCWDVAPYSAFKFNVQTVKVDVYRFLNILFNLHNLVLNEKFSLKYAVKNSEDQWIINKFNKVCEQYLNGLEDFEIQKSGRAMYDFIVEDLSRKYVQIVRDRMLDDETPFSIIYDLLKKSCILLVPIIPYITEKIYQNFKSKEKLQESIQLEIFPKIEKYDDKIIDEFELLFDVITTALSSRDKSGIGLRWPLQKINIECDACIKKYDDILKNQLNIKEIHYAKVNTDFELKPNYRNLGKKLGAQTTEFIEYLNKNMQKIKIDYKKFSWKTFTIEENDFEIITKDIEGHIYSEGKNCKVLLSTATSAELEREGMTRELIRRVQILRKDSGLQKQDKIKLHIKGAILQGYDKEIMLRTNAQSLEWTDNIKTKNLTEFSLKNHHFTIGF